MTKDHDDKIIRMSGISRQEEIALAVLFGTAEEIARLIRDSQS